MTIKEIVKEYNLTEDETTKVVEYYLFLRIKNSGLLETLNIIRVNLNNVFGK